MNNNHSFLLFLFFVFSLCAYAGGNNKHSLNITVVDKQTQEPLEFTYISVDNGGKKTTSITDKNGRSVFNELAFGTYQLSVSYIGYEKWEKVLEFKSDTAIRIHLKLNQTLLDEVVVTASESDGVTSSSVIDRKAMQHLQPSSFTDLLELLPGGMSKTPSMSVANLIKIREVGVADNNFSTSSLGTSFVIDGIPVSTDANLQYTEGSQLVISGNEADKSRNTINKGVDMRSVPTDQIEQVEIVRGIPSVRYGDLTSGLVLIKRKKGAAPWEARFKSDGVSKLFAGSKGFYFSRERLNLNIGIDFLDAKASPTNRMENYQRMTASVRINKEWENDNYHTEWSSNIDLGHTLDDEKTDPDADYTYTDKYSSGYNRISLGNTFSRVFKEDKTLKTIEVNTGIAYQSDQIQQTRFVQISTPTYIPNTTESGVHDGAYLPSNWTSYLEVDGKPLNLFVQALGKFNSRIGHTSHDWLIGAEWRLDKNYGKGQVYDPAFPPSIEMKTRPRAYSDIPAKDDISFFIEDVVDIPIATHLLKLTGGIRGTSLLNLDSQYKMNEKIYFDPRLNSQWNFPRFYFAGQQVKTDLSVGIGWHSKFPTLDQLYPDFVYTDIEQLNYYHMNPDYRRINLITYKRKVIGYDLEPASNRKIDIRLGLTIGKNKFSITYFNEDMSSAFRSEVRELEPQAYKEYDITSIDPNALTAPPRLEDLTYEPKSRLAAYRVTTNGSRIFKEGIEYQFASQRIESLKTRLTINGAWFRSRYDNSAPVYKNPGKIIDGDWIQEYGIYKSDGGAYRRERFNTNFMFDTYIPNLGFEFSTSVQCLWFELKQTEPFSGTPFAYVDASGDIHPYTDMEKTDKRLQWLNKTVNPSAFEVYREPLSIGVNLKASKNFRDKIYLSLFVNQLLNYIPDYKVNGAIIRRNVLPYFGMELTLRL